MNNWQQTAGNSAVMYGCQSNAAQKWQLNADGQMQSVGTNLCLSGTGARRAAPPPIDGRAARF